jgi:hypothetical protein
MKVYERLKAHLHSFFRFLHQLQVSGQSHVPVALPRGKRPRRPLKRKLVGPQRRSGLFQKRKIYYCCRVLTHDSSVDLASGHSTDYTNSAPSFLYILANNQLDALLHVFIYLFHLSTCFEHQVLIIRRSNCIKRDEINKYMKKCIRLVISKNLWRDARLTEYKTFCVCPQKYQIASHNDPQDIFSALVVFKPTPPTNMKQQCHSCQFTQIKSFKENYGTQNIVNDEFVTHKYAAAEDVRHTYYSTGKITNWGEVEFFTWIKTYMKTNMLDLLTSMASILEDFKRSRNILPVQK